MSYSGMPGPAPQAQPLTHPLDVIPLFRRWPPSHPRNAVYTAVWSGCVGLLLAWAAMLLDERRHAASLYVMEILPVSLLIGYLVHGALLLGNRLLNGWPRQARGWRRALYHVALVGASVVLGITLGRVMLTGENPMIFLRKGGVLVDTLVVAVVMALFMYAVRAAGDRRIARETLAARQAEMLAASAQLLAEARLRALQAQIEPHFLYNTLANVLGLIGNQPAQAQHMLERFIDYLRATLAASREERSTLGAEARLIAAYLDVLAVRMGERLRYRIAVPDELRQFPIAPMLLQPLVENAIAHGLEPKVDGGEVTLSAQLRGDRLCLEISDTGVGLSVGLGTGPDGRGGASAKPGGGVGLSNLRDRLRILYNGAARVELLENQPCGMTVRLLLPLNASSPSNPPAP